VKKRKKEALLRIYKKKEIARHEEALRGMKGFKRKYDYLSAARFDLLSKQRDYTIIKAMINSFYPGHEDESSLYDEICVPYGLAWFDEKIKMYASPRVPPRTMFETDVDYGLYLNVLMDMDEIPGYVGTAPARAKILETYYGIDWEIAYEGVCRAYEERVVHISRYDIDYNHLDHNFISIRQLQQFLEIARDEKREVLVELFEEKLY